MFVGLTNRGTKVPSLVLFVCVQSRNVAMYSITSSCLVWDLCVPELCCVLLSVFVLFGMYVSMYVFNI